MTVLRMSEAASLLGVSDDTVRRWADAGRFVTEKDQAGRRVVAGAALAQFAVEQAAEAVPMDPGHIVGVSARNRFTGLVTRVVKDGVMAQVEMQAGPFRIVSLMSADAAEELELAPGALAVASVKSTNVVIEIPHHS